MTQTSRSDAVDWAALRLDLVRIALSRGMNQAEADDAAQEAIVRILSRDARCPEAYARLEVRGQRVREAVCGRGWGKRTALDVERMTVEPDQEDIAIMRQRLFMVDACNGLALKAALGGTGGAARVARHRARRAASRALGEGGEEAQGASGGVSRPHPHP